MTMHKTKWEPDGSITEWEGERINGVNHWRMVSQTYPKRTYSPNVTPLAHPDTPASDESTEV